MSTSIEKTALGLRYHQAGYLEQAKQLYLQVLELDPAHADAHHHLGVLAYQLGQHDQAILLIRQAIALNPGLANFHSDLGLVYEALGQLDQAEISIHHSLRIDPGYVDAHYNLAVTLQGQGRLEEAASQYDQTLLLQPSYSQAHNNLGNVLAGLSRHDDAVTHYQQALDLQPAYAEAHHNLGVLLAEMGKLDEATEHFQDSYCLKPTNIVRVLLATLLPPLYKSNSELHGWRQRLVGDVRRLHDERLAIDVTHQIADPVFLLPYQGLNDRELRTQIARLYVAPQESVDRANADGRNDIQHPSNSHKIRIGFISSYFKDHTIAALMRGLIAHLDRERFFVTVISIGSHGDSTAEWIRQRADKYLVAPSHLGAARRLIREQYLDVLFYTDVGMEPVTYTLAFSRLAPVQCVTWGHPVTTGIPTVDYFISSVDLETAEAEQHYSEQLVRLRDPAIYYYRPALAQPIKHRGDLGLPESGNLYACPQMLAKFHPDFDEILAGILRRDARATLVLIKGRYRHCETLLRERFALTMPDVSERVCFLPALNRADFLNLNSLADVLLDPPHFGGGNTSYEGLALGVPIVTLPSRLLRGRITTALYTQMGVHDCIASSSAQYVDLAVRLGTDKEYRAAVSAKIRAASDVLFENTAGIRELEQFLHEAVRRARAGLPAAPWPGN